MSNYNDLKICIAGLNRQAGYATAYSQEYTFQRSDSDYDMIIVYFTEERDRKTEYARYLLRIVL